MSGAPILVWDFDETLGDFRSLYQHWDRSKPVTVRLRPDLRPALEQLSAAGFRHRILTLASSVAAEGALRAAGLRDHFEAIEGLGERGKGDVDGIAACYGLSEVERGERLVFIGDHIVNDRPQDPRVLFHLELQALERSALDCAALLLKLRELGQGSFLRGFLKLRRGRWYRAFGAFEGEPRLRQVEGLEPLALVTMEAGPIIAFAEEVRAPKEAEELSFIPEELGG